MSLLRPHPIPFTCMPQPCQLSKLPPAFTFNIVPYYMDDFTHKPNALIVIHSHRDMHAPFIWIMCLNIPPTLADFFVIFWYKYKLVNKLSFFLFLRIIPSNECYFQNTFSQSVDFSPITFSLFV